MLDIFENSQIKSINQITVQNKWDRLRDKFTKNKLFSFFACLLRQISFSVSNYNDVW